MLKSLHRFDLTCILLSVITIMSWRLGIKHVGQALHLDIVITAAVLAFSLVKARFIMREFMEVRTAPLAIKLITDAWLVGVFAILMTIYWRAS